MAGQILHNTNTDLLNFEDSLMYLRRLSNNPGSYYTDKFIKIYNYIPYFMINSNLYLNEYKKFKFKYKENMFVKIEGGEIKSTGNLFYYVFKYAGFLKKVILKENVYFVGKGFISDKHLNPLIIITSYIKDIIEKERNIPKYGLYFNSSNELNKDLEYRYTSHLNTHFHNKENLDIFISRRLYDLNYINNNKKICNEIHSKILPYLMSLDIRTHIRKDLDIFTNILIDKSLNSEGMDNLLKEEVERIVNKNKNKQHE